MKELPVRVYSEQALDEYLARAGIEDGRVKAQPVRQEPRPSADPTDHDEDRGGVVKIRVFHDYGAEHPLWSERGSLLSLQSLPLSDGLRREFLEWGRRADAIDFQVVNRDPVLEAELRALAVRAQDELGPGYELVVELD